MFLLFLTDCGSGLEKGETHTNTQTQMVKSGCFLVLLMVFFCFFEREAILTGIDGLLDPVDKLGDSCVDSGPHGMGAAQTPRGHALQHKPVLAFTHQGASAVAL